MTTSTGPTGMTRYYVSRTLLSAGFAALLVPAGAEWWMAVIVGVLGLAFFAWAPRSGRYVLQERGGIAPMRTDEMSRGARSKAAGVAFAAAILGLGAVVIYYSMVAETDVPVWVLSIVVAGGAFVYMAADFWFRRS